MDQGTTTAAVLPLYRVSDTATLALMWNNRARHNNPTESDATQPTAESSASPSYGFFTHPYTSYRFEDVPWIPARGLDG